MDLRHRHDETRRDHYVAMHLAFDNLYQALLDAATVNNQRNFDAEGLDARTAATEAKRKAAIEAASVAQEKYNQVLRDYRIATMFAPPEVMEPRTTP